jgi:hypothetical protein
MILKSLSLHCVDFTFLHLPTQHIQVPPNLLQRFLERGRRRTQIAFPASGVEKTAERFEATYGMGTAASAENQARRIPHAADDAGKAPFLSQAHHKSMLSLLPSHTL